MRRGRASCRAARRTGTRSPVPLRSRRKRERREREKALVASWKEPLAAGRWTEIRRARRRSALCRLERLECDYGARVDDSRDHLHPMADKVADIDIRFHVEFG